MSVICKREALTAPSESFFERQRSASGAKQGGQVELEEDEETAQLVPHPPRITRNFGALMSADTV